MKVITTCEHGGNEIPDHLADSFINASKDLNSHLGIDFGARDVFDRLSGKIADFSKYAEVSRLLVDLNRSLKSPDLFSIYTSNLPENMRKMILEEYYHPYRDSVINKIRQYFQSGEWVIHISVHSFTPVLNDEVRKNDIGLLYDPDNGYETECCKIWKRTMEKVMPGIKVLHNYPYLGINEGFTKYLRELFPVRYAGIELEVNQKFFTETGMNKEITEMITKSLEESISILKKTEPSTNPGKQKTHKQDE